MTLVFIERLLASEPGDALRGDGYALGSLACFYSGQLPRALAWASDALPFAPPDSIWRLRALGNLSAALAHVDRDYLLYPRHRVWVHELLVREPAPDERFAMAEALAFAVNVDAGFDSDLADALVARLAWMREQARADELLVRAWCDHGIAWYALLAGRGDHDAAASGEAALEAFTLARDRRNVLAANALVGLAHAATVPLTQRSRALEASALAVTLSNARGGQGFPVIYARVLRALTISLVLRASCRGGERTAADLELADEAEMHARFALEALGSSTFVGGNALSALARVALWRGEVAAAVAHAEDACASFGALGGCTADALATILECTAEGHPPPRLAERTERARALVTRIGPRSFAHDQLTRALAGS